MGRTNLSSASIFDCGKADAAGMSTGYKRNYVNDEGETVTVKLYQRPSLKVVSPAGNVQCIVLTNGAGDRNRDSAYANMVRTRKREQGFVPYGECPIESHYSKQYLPKSMRGDRPCDGASDKACCKHVKVIIEQRQKVQNEKMAERDAAHRNDNVEASKLAYANQLELYKQLLAKQQGSTGGAEGA